MNLWTYRTHTKIYMTACETTYKYDGKGQRNQVLIPVFKKLISFIHWNRHHCCVKWCHLSDASMSLVIWLWAKERRSIYKVILHHDLHGLSVTVEFTSLYRQELLFTQHIALISDGQNLRRNSIQNACATLGLNSHFLCYRSWQFHLLTQIKPIFIGFTENALTKKAGISNVCDTHF